MRITPEKFIAVVEGARAMGYPVPQWAEDHARKMRICVKPEPETSIEALARMVS